MSDLLAFNIYRTEKLNLTGELFTINFTRRNDGQEFAIHALNQSGSKNLRVSFTKETADDFSILQGDDLATEVYKVLLPELVERRSETHSAE